MEIKENNLYVIIIFYIFALSITTDMKKFGYLTVKDSYRCVVTLFLSF